MLTILLERDIFQPGYTLGVVSIIYPGAVWYESEQTGWVDNEFPGRVCPFGYSCEDTDRNLDLTMSLTNIKKVKVKGRTAIPIGVYVVERTHSPKYGRVMPQVLGVKGFEGIRIHSGNTADDTMGCVLPGLTRDVAGGSVGKSRLAVEWLERRIEECEERGWPVKLIVAHRP